MVEKRTYNCEVRTNDKENGGIIEGLPIVFESETDLGGWIEIIHKGALDEADISDVRFMVNHDFVQLPLARYRKGNNSNTMELMVNDQGVDIKVDLDTDNNTDARNLYSAVKRRDVSGMSFAFTIAKERWEEDKKRTVRHIDKIEKVFEVSAVTFPAYESTEIQARQNQKGKKEIKTLELEKLKIRYLYGEE